MLELLYLQAVRALVDYRPPVLVALSPSQQKRIEVIQNQAIRTMFETQGRTSGCIMQSETQMVTLATSIQQIVPCQVTKISSRTWSLLHDHTGQGLATMAGPVHR